MKAVKVIYQRVYSLSGYQNEKIGIELEVEEGEKAQDVYNKAKEFVDKMHSANDGSSQFKLEQAQRIVDNPDEFTGRQVKEAQKILSELDDNMDTLPF